MSDVYAGSIDAPAPNRSEEMETAVLTEIMMGGRKSYEILSAEVSLDDFCNPQNRRLFEILGECAAEASADDVCFFPAAVRNHCDPNRADDRLLAGDAPATCRIAQGFASPHSYT
ncbi:DnaB-like helicase N-terminal domain-containing protein, partial [Enterococcus faecium]|uniref:DnaB-like helicase N-terminal domain-containing protein n=1 Tax=Enterococcus faecium TaxID=1352 RepID=UPI003DA5129C